MKDMLTREEAARYLGVKPGTLAVWASEKRHLPFVKMGGRALYRKRDLDDFVETRTTRPTTEGNSQ